MFHLYGVIGSCEAQIIILAYSALFMLSVGLNSQVLYQVTHFLAVAFVRSKHSLSVSEDTSV